MSQPAHLAAWQAERRAHKRDAVKQAIRRLDARGIAINFAVVAGEAGVDRSWLYSQKDLALAIRRHREGNTAQMQARPEQERASDASLRTRLSAAYRAIAVAREQNSRLRRQIRALHEEIASLRGERWEDAAGNAH